MAHPVLTLPHLDDLRIFCIVVRKKGFAAAAIDMGVSRALISKRIGILEGILGVRLLHRSTRNVTVTEDGNIINEWALRILEDVEQMNEAVAAAKAMPRGALRICAGTGFGRNYVARSLSALAAQYPALEIQLELLDRPVDMLAEGFDLDIRVGELSESSMIARRIGTNFRIFCASPRYLDAHGRPEILDDLTRHKCIPIRERDQDFLRWKVMGPAGLETVRIGGPLSGNNGEAVLRWAIDGHGIALRSMWDVAPYLKSGELEHVLPGYQQEADIWAVSPSRLSGSAKVRVCVLFLEAWLSENLGK